MAHHTAPRVDSGASVQVMTPGGLIVHVPYGEAEGVIRDLLDENTQAGDNRAAIAMARLTGLDVTIRRETQTTVRAADLED